MSEEENTNNAVPSEVFVPIQMEISVLQQMLNELVEATFFKGVTNTTPNFNVHIYRTGDIQLTSSDHVIAYQLPLNIDITKGKWNAQGTLMMSFDTEINILTNWELKTRTRLHQYHWIAKPKLDIGFVKIPIQFILDTIIKSSKNRLEDQIDEKIQSKTALKYKIEELWNIGQQPLKIHPKYPVYLISDTQKIQTAPFKTVDNQLNIGIFLSSYTSIYVGELQQLNRQQPIPAFISKDIDADTSVIQLPVSIHYEAIEKYGMEFLKNKEFDLKGKKIQVERFKIKSLDQKIDVELVISGELNGTVFIEGTPTIDHQKNRLVVDNLSFDFKTKNLIHKTAAWLLKGEVLKIIQKNLDVPLDEKLVLLKNIINQQIKEATSNIKLIQLDSIIKILNINRLEFRLDSIETYLEAEVDINAQLKK